jgi:hypothetical protein
MMAESRNSARGGGGHCQATFQRKYVQFFNLSNVRIFFCSPVMINNDHNMSCFKKYRINYLVFAVKPLS